MYILNNSLELAKTFLDTEFEVILQLGIRKYFFEQVYRTFLVQSS